VMDGLELLMELQRTFPRVKVIAISGGRRTLEVAKAFTPHTFEKPFSLEEVVDTVYEIVAASMPSEVVTA